MKLVEPSFRWLGCAPDGLQMIANIAEAGRVCYQSEPKSSDADFVRNLIRRGHESVLEHEKISVIVTCDRGVSHEIVRHRIASYSQESTRYCNYSHEKFDHEITVVKPCDLVDPSPAYSAWEMSCEYAEHQYFRMLHFGCTPQTARAVLPNALKTQIVITMNLREWRHFFRLRCDKAAHPDMRVVAKMLLDRFRDVVPVVFNDLLEVLEDV